jgi:hypothetical protein
MASPQPATQPAQHPQPAQPPPPSSTAATNASAEPSDTTEPAAAPPWPPAANSAIREEVERRKADRLLTPREVICEGDDELARAFFFPALIEEPLARGLQAGGVWRGRAQGMAGEGGADGAAGGEYSYDQFVEFVLGEVEKELGGGARG